MRAFVGIVSPRGIEHFYPEDPATIRFLWRRARRQRQRLACFWSVLPSEVAEVIQAALVLGLTQEALQLLQRLARDYGALLPEQDEPAPRSAA